MNLKISIAQTAPLKWQEEIRKIEGVTFADVNFLTQKITVEADDSEFDNIMKKAD